MCLQFGAFVCDLKKDKGETTLHVKACRAVSALLPVLLWLNGLVLSVLNGVVLSVCSTGDRLRGSEEELADAVGAVGVTEGDSD